MEKRQSLITIFIIKVKISEKKEKTNKAVVYLRRQQERDLMQKARLLTGENSVSFQMFLILLSSIKEGQSNT